MTLNLRIAVLAAIVAVYPALAAASPSGDWPCQQRKIATLSPGTFWAGDIAAAGQTWQQTPGVPEAVARLVSRRLPVEQIQQTVDGFAGALPADARTTAATALFAGSFAELNRLRADIVIGIERFTRAQRTVADRLRADRQELDALARAERNPEQQRRAEELQNSIQWQTRVHKERENSLTYICETPVLLEQRIFAIARALQPLAAAP